MQYFSFFDIQVSIVLVTSKLEWTPVIKNVSVADNHITHFMRLVCLILYPLKTPGKHETNGIKWVKLDLLQK